ncbi:uncharacterized protein BO87DRAFT_447241 [Aspergillus neoniger CBS 115656]|uniref:LITAF domain-containing protein n=1 Tax=Aspergillus neoniger (strain CBS 115656) TaxID=1448310 RepID=A0A318Y652_ASPNB|nr:hypothetical protein BO87DRAFT_447241 [Aspergillus neoniger CBS 115656]PYH29755.1 hypothetical protein BO87DRAFT_447241 [Aspergillus neoniger CBS 115656]
MYNSGLIYLVLTAGVFLHPIPVLAVPPLRCPTCSQSLLLPRHAGYTLLSHYISCSWKQKAGRNQWLIALSYFLLRLLR